MSHALAALKKRHDARQAAISASEGKVAGLHDAFVESMGSSLATLGSVADATGDGWRSTKIEVVTGSVFVDVVIPKSPMVEIDGLEFFDALFRSAENVAPHVLKHVAPDQLATWLMAEGVVVSEDGLVTAVVAAVMRKIMRAQGWKFLAARSSWRSPVWLFPEVMIPESAVVAHVKESLSLKGLIAASTPEPAEFDVLVANAGTE